MGQWVTHLSPALTAPMPALRAGAVTDVQTFFFFFFLNLDILKHPGLQRLPWATSWASTLARHNIRRPQTVRHGSRLGPSPLIPNSSPGGRDQRPTGPEAVQASEPGARGHMPQSSLSRLAWSSQSGPWSPAAGAHHGHQADR